MGCEQHISSPAGLPEPDTGSVSIFVGCVDEKIRMNLARHADEGALNIADRRVEADTEYGGGLRRSHTDQRERCGRTFKGSTPLGIGSLLVVSEVKRLLTATTSARVSVRFSFPSLRLMLCRATESLSGPT